MTEQEAVLMLDALNNADPEISHGEADDILIRFLRAHEYFDIAAAYVDARERCGFWYA